MHVSLFAHWKDNVPESGALSWEEFCDHVLLNGVQAARVAEKNQTPAFSPVEYAKGATRGNEGVIAVHAAVLDYDAITTSDTVRILEYLKDIKGAVYSTFSHGKKSRHSRDLAISGSDAGSHSFRVVLPLDRPVPASEWPSFWLRLQSLLPVPSDPSCKDPARIYGLPYTPAEFLEESFFERNDNGPALPVAEVLALPLPSVAGSALHSTGVKADRLDPKHARAHGKRLANSKHPETAQIGRWIIDISMGQPWTEEQGQRHAAMLLVTAALERQFPTTSIDALTSLWAPSVTAIAATDQTFDIDGRLADISRAYEGARARRSAQDAERRAEREEIRKQSILRARGDGRSDPYTEEELTELAGLNGCTVQELARRWVLSVKGAYYVLTLDGYEGPYGASDVMQVCRDKLAPAGIATTEYNAEGQERVIALPQFLAKYGSAVRDVIADMTAPRSYIDETNTLHEAVCRLREITPEYNALVDQYLTVAGGKHAEKYKDWLATFTDLGSQTCALYLKGKKSTGKTLIPTLLSRMYRGVKGPTELKRVLDNFNEDLTKCPIVNVDEGMPKERYSRVSSADLRSLIGTSSRTLSRKFVPNAALEGCVRLVIGANNDSLLQFGEDLTADDLDAINSRFLCIDMGQNVADWLKANGLNRRRIKREWVEADAFAKHVMWLRENRNVEPGDRWLVEGEASEVQAMTATSGDIREGVCQWIVGYLEDPRMAQAQAPGLALIEPGNSRSSDARDRGGQLWLNSSAILNTWETYVKHSNAKPTVTKIGRALGGLQLEHSDKDTVRGIKKSRLKFHRINMSLIFQWAESNGHGDVTAMRALLANPAAASARATN
jgi:hypothetical protein